MLLVASYVFYSAWDWRFLSLILISTVIDYFCGLKIEEASTKEKKKLFLTFSLVSNLSILCAFKYFNFFVANFVSLINKFGVDLNYHTLKIILPMGISFYTLQSLSYTIDIYRKGMKPTKRFLDFALFVAFFPQLVAGPIERAKNLLPQMSSKRTVTLEKFYEGCHLIFWGIFLKVFIADNLSAYVDPIFAKSPPYNGLHVVLATYAFSIQLFCDFAGYSHVARGLGKLMGFDIMINFNLPYFTTNIQDFWNKWHISLSTWVRDYLYMPLFFGMSQIKPMWRIPVVLMITMAIMGLWHGANWIFIVWGLYHGFLLTSYMFLRQKCGHWIKPKSAWGQQLWLWTRIIFMFHIVAFGMMVFRAQFGKQILDMTYYMFFNFGWFEGAGTMILKILFYSWILLVVQLFQFKKNDLMAIFKMNPYYRAAFYYVCIFLLINYGVTDGKEFIYFQF